LVADAQTERKETAMATVRLANAQIWVLDQDEALEFWTKKMGWEVRADITMPELGDFRWLSVGPPGQEDISVVLMAIPGPPVMDDATKKQIEELVAKGWGGTVFLTADDVQAAYEELKDRGVEFTEAPTEQPYGLDSEFRDPSGNKYRLGKPTV
jgi:catechol 2,3-dioxygenase-like lactoylglutathione lyase family enzyme